jgi:hypothetical protein
MKARSQQWRRAGLRRIFQPGDTFGDLVATATEINLAGAGEVVITRGQTSQQVVAMD